MRRHLLSTLIFVSLPVFSASAQNYIPATGYNGAGIVVNMDVLSAAPSLGASPILSQPLAPVAAPVVLRPPIRREAPQPVRAVSKTVEPKKVAAIAPIIAPIVSPVEKSVKSNAPSSNTPSYISPMASLPSGNQSTDLNTSSIAPAPKPLNDLLSDAPVADQKKVAATIASSGMVDARTPEVPSARSSNTSGRQELGSMHDPLPDDITEITGEQTSSVPPVDEMAPVSPPSMPSPIAQRGNDIQTAMLTPTTAPIQALVSDDAVTTSDNSQAYRLLFDGNSPDLNPSETSILDNVVSKMKADSNLRLQVRAYANGTPETASAARRLSLKRAMNVREYMMRKSVVGTRLDIRAMGSGSAEMGDEVGRGNAPADRVDIVFAQ